MEFWIITFLNFGRNLLPGTPPHLGLERILMRWSTCLQETLILYYLIVMFRLHDNQHPVWELILFKINWFCQKWEEK